jgi:hypothetical protein
LIGPAVDGQALGTGGTDAYDNIEEKSSAAPTATGLALKLRYRG